MEDDEELRLHCIGCQSFYTRPNRFVLFILEFMTERFCETGFAQNIASLPTRYLPPGNIKMLFYQFSQTNGGISSIV